MASFVELERFVELSDRVSSPGELHSLLVSTVRAMGFDYFALLQHVNLRRMRDDLSHMRSGSFIALHNYPEAFVQKYLEHDWVTNDPILLASERRNVGFRWRDLPTSVRFWRPKNEIAIEARRRGIHDGYTVPTNVPGEPKGSCSFAVGPVSPFPESNMLMAETVAAFAFQAARSLLLEVRKLPPPLKSGGITERQMECLVLVAKGKSDWEIAQILGIGQETVKHHIRMARERYDVPTRVQAAIRAIFESKLTLDDLM